MIQSRAAWTTKKASTLIYNEIYKNNDFDKVKMIVQIHDQIRLEVSTLEKGRYYRKVLENCMREAANLLVPHDRVKIGADAYIVYDCWEGKKEVVYKELL